MGSGKPRGIQAARKLRVKRRLNRYVTTLSYPRKQVVIPFLLSATHISKRRRFGESLKTIKGDDFVKRGFSIIKTQRVVSFL